MSIPNDDSGEVDLARFEKLEALFQAVLEKPPAQREQFLRENTDDAALREEVLRLLRWREERSTVRNTPDSNAVEAERAPQRIGAYRVIRELGVGGMGTVLLAERLLGDTRQNVALKLIRGFPTAQARERLARERTLLAELNHPNIARLL